MSEQTPVQTVLACSQCRRPFPQSDVVQIAGNWVCAGCKPGYLSRVMASGGATSAQGWHYGGFWIRFGARMIDGFLLGIVQASLALALFGTFGAQFMPNVIRSEPQGLRVSFQILSYGIGFLYEVLFLHYRGATLGKMAVGLQVVRSNGESLGWGVCVARYFMSFVSALILLIGYIMAGFDSEKRALHDRVCDTRVVYKQSLA
jgi:uncharacterized RDD family membrane protein YckC